MQDIRYATLVQQGHFIPEVMAHRLRTTAFDLSAHLDLINFITAFFIVLHFYLKAHSFPLLIYAEILGTTISVIIFLSHKLSQVLYTVHCLSQLVNQDNQMHLSPSVCNIIHTMAFNPPSF